MSASRLLIQQPPLSLSLHSPQYLPRKFPFLVSASFLRGLGEDPWGLLSNQLSYSFERMFQLLFSISK